MSTLTANMGKGAGLTAAIGDALSWGSDVVTDGGLENWTGNTPDDWSKTESGSGTVTSEGTIKTAGSYSAKLYNPAGGGNTVKILQSISGNTGTRYKLTLDLRCDTSSRTIIIRSYDSAGATGTLNESYSIVTADTWYDVEYNFAWGTNDNAIEIMTNSNGSFYIDEVTLEPQVVTSDLTANLGIGSGLIAAMGIVGTTGFSLGDTYQTIYDAYSTTPDEADALIDDTMVEGLVDDGTWAKLDGWWVFANHVTGADSLRDWITPANTATAYNTPTWTQWQGWTGNGSNAYIDLEFNLSSDGVNYTQNSASIGEYNRTNIEELRVVVGANESHDSYIIPRYATNLATMRINSTGAGTVANTDSRGMYIANRVLSTHQDLYKNKVRIQNYARASTGVPNLSLYCLCQNKTGSANSFCTQQLSIVFTGSGLTQTDIDNITDRFETRMDAHSTGVI